MKYKSTMAIAASMAICAWSNPLIAQETEEVSEAAAEVAPPELELVLEELVALGEAWDFGKTALGGRFIIPITGGTFEGPQLRGEVLPGGWDLQVVRDDGCRVLNADYFIRTDDGVNLRIINRGTACPSEDPAASSPIITHPIIEAPLGKYEWLNKEMFIGTVRPEWHDGAMFVRIHIYRAGY